MQVCDVCFKFPNRASKDPRVTTTVWGEAIRGSGKQYRQKVELCSEHAGALGPIADRFLWHLVSLALALYPSR